MRQYDAVCDGDHKFTLFSPNGQNKNNEECVFGNKECGIGLCLW